MYRHIVALTAGAAFMGTNYLKNEWIHLGSSLAE